MSDLRIAVDARPLSFPMVGITRYTYELLRRILNSSHQWYLYSNQPIIHSLPELPNVHVRCGVVPLKGTGTVYAQMMFSIWAKLDRINVFWSPRHHLPLLLSPRIKTLLTIHDLVWKRFPETMTRPGRLVERVLMPRSIAKADKIVTVSNAVAKELNENYPSCVLEMIYPGMNVTPTPNRNRKSNPYYLFVGTLEPRKNLPRIIKAFQLFSQVNDHYDFVLVGSVGWGGQQIETMIEGFGLSDRVKLTGRVTESELSAYYSGCTAVVMPSLYEGFGLPLLEGMGCGAPVITSNYGACREVAGQAGLFVNPFSEHSICDAMLALTDESLQQNLSRIAVQRAKKFNWRYSAERILRVIESLAT